MASSSSLKRPFGLFGWLVALAIPICCLSGCGFLAIGLLFGDPAVEPTKQPFAVRIGILLGTLIILAVTIWFTRGLWDGFRDGWIRRLRWVTLDATVVGARTVVHGGDDPDEYFATVRLRPPTGPESLSVSETELEIQVWSGDRATTGAQIQVRYVPGRPGLTRVRRATPMRVLAAVIGELLLIGALLSSVMLVGAIVYLICAQIFG